MLRRLHHLLLLFLPCLAVLTVAPAPASGAAGGHAREGEGPYRSRRPCAEDACPVCCAAWQVGLRMVPLRAPVRTRCRPQIASVVLAPRGFVRPEDLGEMRVALDIDAPEALALVFETDAPRGATYELAYHPQYVDQREPLPPALRRVLSRPDACVRVRLVGAGRTWAETSFRVVASDGGADPWLRGLERELADRPPTVRRLVVARALLDAGFDVAAWRAAEAVLTEVPREPHAAALVQVALARLGLQGTEARLQNDQLVRDLLQADPGQRAPDCRALETDAPDPAWDLAPPATGC